MKCFEIDIDQESCVKISVFDIPFFYNRKEEKCVFAVARTVDGIMLLEKKQKFLSVKESERLDSVGSEKVKIQYCLGRILTKTALSAFVDNFAFGDVSVLNEKSGRPIIESFDSEYATSITHTNEIVACLVFKSAFSFGIDIESPKKKAMETIESIISADESVPRDLRHYAVAWTLKESLSKALKSGFRLPFGEFKMSDFCEERDIFTCRYQKHPEFCGTAIFCNGTSVAFTYPSEMEFHIPYSDLIDLFNNILLKF